jgi:hypothetical protein
LVEKKLLTIFLVILGIVFLSGNVFAGSLTITHTRITNNEYFDVNTGLNIEFTVNDQADLNYFWFELNNDINYYSKESDPKFDGNKLTLNLPELTNGKHEIVFDGNDVNGVLIGEQTINFYVDTINPQLSNAITTAGTNYSKEKIPTINITLNKEAHYFKDGNISISCNDINWIFFGLDWSGTGTTASFSGFDITNDSNCSSGDGEREIHLKLFDNFNRESNKLIVQYKYDGTKPTPPKNFTASAGNTEITLTWTAADADVGGSGNEKYNIYWLKPNSDWALHSTSTATSKTITGLTNGSQYSFRMSTTDVAGNESNFTEVKSATPRAEQCDCDLEVKRNGQSIVYAKDYDVLTVSCNIEKTSDNVKIKYRYNSNNFSDLTSARNNIRFVDTQHTIASGYNSIEFQCVWTYQGTNFNTEELIIIDNEKPTIVWNTLPTKLENSVEISANIVDNRVVSRVDFELEGTTHSSSRTGNKYYFNYDTTRLKNGTYNVKVTATDGAGNIATSTKSITIENVLTEEEQRTKAINEAKSKRQIVEDLIKYYEERGLKLNEEILRDFQNAKLLLGEAEGTTDNNIARQKAIQAKNTFDEINDKIDFVDVESQEREFVEDIKIYFSSVGLTGEQLEQAVKNANNSKIKRSLTITKIGEEYRARIKLSFELEGQYKIIEIIPKEFIDSASKIFSNTEFNIIEDDPIIEFMSNGQTIYYSINLSKEEAEKMLEDNILEKFKSPPIILDNEQEIVLSRENWVFLIVIILIIIVIIVGGASILILGKNGDFGKDDPIGKIKQTLFKEKKKKVNWKYKK